VIVSDRSPNNTAHILFTGPNTTTTNTEVCGKPQNFSDFYFECKIVLQSDTADNARYNVSLTFDGEPDKSKPETHVTLDSTSRVARFPSSSLIGNMGKSVFIACFQQYFNASCVILSFDKTSLNARLHYARVNNQLHFNQIPIFM